MRIFRKNNSLSFDGSSDDHGRRRGWVIRVLVVAVAVGWGPMACSENGTIVDPPDDEQNQPVDELDLLFLRPAEDAPPLLTTDTSFVATKGQDTRVEMFYAPAPGSGEDKGERFLRFELEEETLLRYPNGHPMAGALFQEGDTITIRIQIAEDRLLATLEPSGLQFDPFEPAELELRYPEADDDYDDDGSPDPERETEIDLWRQENPGDPWTRVGDVKSEDEDKIEARLLSFSRYALAI
jgi:hypothetical protein